MSVQFIEVKNHCCENGPTFYSGGKKENLVAVEKSPKQSTEEHYFFWRGRRVYSEHWNFAELTFLSTFPLPSNFVFNP